MRTRRPVLLAAAVLVAALGPSPARGQVSGGSTLTAWSLTGYLLANGVASQVNAKAAACPRVHADIEEYNQARPEEEQLPHRDTPEEALVSLEEFLGELGYGKTELEFCTWEQTDGWYPASEWVVGLAEGGLVTATPAGPVACPDSGQVLLVKSAFLYYYDEAGAQGRWEWGYGTNWQTGITPVGALATEELEFRCVALAAGDFGRVADRVPTAQVNLNPLVMGLTGLDTWLWYDFSDPASYLLTAQVQIFAYGAVWTLDMNAWVDKIRWNVDCQIDCDYMGPESGFNHAGFEYTHDLPDNLDPAAGPLAPAPVYDGGGPSERDAADIHVYRTKDTYLVSTAVVWRGYYTLDLPGGFRSPAFTYPAVVVTNTRDYQVVEIRSKLISPDD